MNLQKIAVVTGGGSGIGAAAARSLADDGWLVVVSGRRKETLDALVAEARRSEGRLEAIAVDVTDEESVTRLFATTLERFGRIDLLFNNAGASAAPSEISELPLETWNNVVAVNLTGVFLCTREAFRIMREQQPMGGRIINNGSLAAYAPRPLSLAYTATKHAITGLTKSTSLDGRRFNIACGQIDIGNAATDMGSGAANGTMQADRTIQPEPLMDVDDVGRAIRYMASLPLDSNVATMTVMATKMPYVGRG